jgi:molybdopterin-containing oxidoreductase family membrane subunit
MKHQTTSSENLDTDAALFAPLLNTSRKFYVTVALLALLVAFGAYALVRQWTLGLGITGMNRPVFWGIYITNFVFFIGLSHAGTLVSAILRIVKAEWRRPFTRAAEAVTVFSLPFGAGSIILDLGRPDRLLNVILYGRFQSSILWDVASVSLYMVSSIFYFYLALIPDIATCRDQLGLDENSFRAKLYRALALGWTGTERQHRRLDKLMNIMAVWLTILVVIVHTVVSWIFAMTVVPSWHGPFIGPYFLAGAIFSGVGAVIITTVVLRHVYHLEDYIKPVHINAMAQFLLALSLVWVYLTFVEYFTTYYGNEPAHMLILNAKFWQEFSPMFWVMVAFCFVIPVTILGNPKTRTIAGAVIASIFVNIGMWIERYIVIIPPMARPRAGMIGSYTPTWIEWAITVGCFAFFILLYALFTKLFPVVAVWEMHEARHQSVPEALERLRSYMPGNTARSLSQE